MNAELHMAIERLYTTFAPYRVGTHLSGCPCCTSEAEGDALLAQPLREVDAGRLADFAFNAMTTWGTARDWKHFLPRVFELVALGAMWVDLQTLYGKLTYAHWEAWPAYERDAIEAFTHELFAASLRHDLATESAVVLESAGYAGLPVEQLLRRWEQPEPSAATSLARFVWHNANGSVSFIWWKDGSAPVCSWLLSGRPAKALFAMVELHLDHPDANEWARSYDVLAALGAG